MKSMATQLVAGILAFAAINTVAGVASAGVTPLANAITYQGLLDIGGSPYTGTADFQFRLFDGSAGGAALVAGPLAANAVTVTNGVFTVSLDFGPVWEGSERWLEIAVDTPAGGGVGPFTTLAPRQAMTASPYALFALSVNGATITNLNANNIATGTIANARTTGNAANAANTLVLRNAAGGFSAGAITATSFTGNGAGLTSLSAASITSGILPIANGGTNAATGAAAISSLSGANLTLNGANVDVANSLFVGASDRTQIGTATMLMRDTTNAFTTVQLQNEATGGRLYLRDEAGLLATSIGGATVGGLLQIYQANGTTLGMNVDGDSAGGGALTVYQTDGTAGITVDGDSAGAGLIVAVQNDGSTGVQIDGDNGTDVGGRISVYNNLSALRAQILGQGASLGGEVSVYDASGNETVEMLGAGTAGAGQIQLRNTAGSTRATLGLEGGGEGQFLLYNAAGVITVEIDADYAASGEGRIVVDELQITGGSDLSEQFDIDSDDATISPKPGMVVCINPDKPGELLVSGKAYDRCVAGIISGAGGIKPGMLMGQKDVDEANGRHPVALTGRVYVRVTDANGSIEPGDLLTTSDEPGKAMKVTDFARAQGAIIGKAMTRADRDTGLVLVLVGLQ